MGRAAHINCPLPECLGIPSPSLLSRLILSAMGRYRRQLLDPPLSKVGIWIGHRFRRLGSSPAAPLFYSGLDVKNRSGTMARARTIGMV